MGVRAAGRDVTAAGAQPRVSAGSSGGGQYSHKPVADTPQSGEMALEPGQHLVLFGEASSTQDAAAPEQFSWEESWAEPSSRFGGLPTERRCRHTGGQSRYWAKVTDFSPDGWTWEVVYGVCSGDWDQETLNRPFWWRSPSDLHNFRPCAVTGEHIAGDWVETRAEAQTGCQDAADEHHCGEGMAWWAYAQRAASEGDAGPDETG